MNNVYSNGLKLNQSVQYAGIHILLIEMFDYIF